MSRAEIDYCLKDEEPALAEPLREAVEAAIDEGVVAAVLVYETNKGKVIMRTVPNLQSVTIGLVNLAVNGIKLSED